MRLKYVTVEDCIGEVFPSIHDRLTRDEPAPAYSSENRGMHELKKILEFVRNQRYYGTFSQKAAYLVCSIVTAHAFTNGNKRLAASVLLQFLISNNVQIRRRQRRTYVSFFKETFPKYQWKDRPKRRDLHFIFLYNLAVALADRPTWNGKSFSEVRDNVVKFFEQLYVID